jgi:hypothetical protein
MDRKIKKALEEQGWRLERRSRGWMALPPDRTKPPVAIHETPSDWRAERNMLAQLKRSGFIWPWKGSK